jgi:DNA polymerase
VSGRADDRRRLIADLRTYLQQQQDAGLGWFLDAGPPATPSPAEASPPEESPTAAPAPAGPPAANPEMAPRPTTRKSPAPAGTDPKGDFESMCRKFVEETLARIQKAKPTVVQEDIFAATAEVPVSLDRAGKEAALAELAEEVAPCKACKLHGGRTQTVFGVGNPDSDLVFIGEAPGRDEDRQGEPFVGRAGKLLNEILKAIKFEREDVYICNILKCRPPDNRDPERDEVDACEPYLKRQLEILEPKVICCLGRVAAQVLLGTNATLTSLRESVHFYEGIPVMATYHPAALLRNPHWKRPAWDDVRKLRALHDALQ